MIRQQTTPNFSYNPSPPRHQSAPSNPTVKRAASFQRFGRTASSLQSPAALARNDSMQSQRTQPIQSPQLPKLYRSATLFKALNGPWSFDRSLASKLAHTPSGTVTGTATFLPIVPTSESSAAEYLYTEEGTMTTSQGLQMNTRRRYIWRLSKATETSSPAVSVFFVKHDNFSPHGLFHHLQFSKSPSQIIRASGSHWCEPDQYEAEYEFSAKGRDGPISLGDFSITYHVKGPQKDYTSVTSFSKIGAPNPLSISRMPSFQSERS
ncbi:hypothetical protein LTS18_014810 [Coniosporium uncinatum]|uniref:Uncharacterized protein n=1 Tax=Coniosporium uncinatum TaxID=93489 RepID=A0ACC3D901_9PEZI|nr:hypothetical protein LTS18_014810 [Coniosporium uncinatum]